MKLKILLIEDDDSHAEIFSFYASRMDPELEIWRMKDGRVAIEFFEENQTPSDVFPELIVVDLNLPFYSGHEVLDAIKKHALAKRIPTVILTSSMSERDITETLTKGANSYLCKPVESENFNEVITRLLKYWSSTEIDHLIYRNPACSS